MNWDQDDITKRLCRALDITGKSLELFSGHGYTDKELVDNSFRPDKPIAEAAMLVYAASAVRHRAGVAERINDLTTRLGPLARSPRVMLNMALHASICVELAVPHILLTRLGARDEEFDLFLKSCISAQVASGHERPPFASLERRWILSLWKGEETEADWHPELDQSLLNWPVDVLGGMKEDAYALTHLAIYCTDFGGREPPRWPRPKSVVLAEARALLARCLDEEDYDLAAELLMMWPQLGAPWCASSAFAFRVLAEVEDQVGVLPSVRTRADRLNRLEGDERTRYAFATAYHTALVMGLLCAASLRDGRVPPARLTGTSAEPALVERLLSFIETDQGHWQSVFGERSAAERGTLAPLLLDIALAQKFRKRDYDAASRLLDIGSQHGIADSPLAGQACEALVRLGAFFEAARERTEAVRAA